MSETSFTPVISKELQATVRNNPKIKRVYFDADNRHYFNVWKLRENKNDKRPESEWSYYGTGIFSHQQEIPGLFNVDKKKESISKGDPEALIVCVLERKDVLTAQPSGSLQAATLGTFENAPQLSDKVLDILAKLESGEFTLTPVVQPAVSEDEDKLS